MGGVGRLWRGELPLVHAFWDWAVIGGLAVNLATIFGAVLLLVYDRTIPALLVGHVLPLPYNVVVIVGVWRAAARYDGDPRLAVAARAVSAVGLTLLTIA